MQTKQNLRIRLEKFQIHGRKKELHTHTHTHTRTHARTHARTRGLFDVVILTEFIHSTTGYSQRIPLLVGWLLFQFYLCVRVYIALSMGRLCLKNVIFLSVVVRWNVNFERCFRLTGFDFDLTVFVVDFRLTGFDWLFCWLPVHWVWIMTWLLFVVAWMCPEPWSCFLLLVLWLMFWTVVQARMLTDTPLKTN